MIIKLNKVHSLIITEDKEYDCYQVELVEYHEARVIKFPMERYGKEAIEEEYGITL